MTAELDDADTAEKIEAAWRFAAATLDAMPGQVCVLDENGVILSTNAAWREFARANGASPERVSEGVSYLRTCRQGGARSDPRGREFAEKLQAMLSGGNDHFSVEYACNSPTVERWFLAQVTRFLDRGKVRVVVAHQDITDRKRIELEALEREHILAESQRIARVGAWSVDLPRGTRHWTEETFRIWGLPAAPLGPPTQVLLALVHPADRAALEGWMQGLAAGRAPSRFQFRITRPDGAARDLDGTGELVEASGSRPRRLIGTVQDVTDRIQAAMSLQESEARLRFALDSTRAGIWEWNLRTDENTWSETLWSLYGLERAGRSPTYSTWIESVHPEDRESIAATVSEAAGKGAEFELEYRVRSASGRERRLLSRGRPLRNQEGEVDRYVGIVIDITESRAVHAQLAVASRLAAVGTLVAGVAHEINNPLTGCMASQGFVMEELQAVRRALGAQDSLDPKAIGRFLDEALEWMEEAQTAVERISKIVKDLSNFGRPSPNRERVGLSEVVSEAVRWLGTAVGTRAVLRVEDRGAPDVMAARGQIAQVVVNLVNNAVKALPEGRSGKITLAIGAGAPGMARLEVIDDGVGIPPHVLDRIFDPFFTTRETGKGTGLGLAICHAIVTAHGGTITATSEVGKGSSFRVELPAARVDVSNGP